MSGVTIENTMSWTTASINNCRALQSPKNQGHYRKFNVFFVFIIRNEEILLNIDYLNSKTRREEDVLHTNVAKIAIATDHGGFHISQGRGAAQGHCKRTIKQNAQWQANLELWVSGMFVLIVGFREFGVPEKKVRMT